MLSQLWQTDLQQALNECSSLPSARLGQALTRSQEFLREQSREFSQSLATESTDNQAAMAPEVAQVRKKLADYDSLLTSIGQKLSRWNALEASSFSNQLEAAISGLASATLAYREIALALRGPTTHAGLNEMWLLLGQLPESQSALPQFLELERAKTQLARQIWSSDQLDEIQSSLGSLHQAFCQTYLDFLDSDRVQAAVSGRDEGMALRPLRAELMLVGTFYARIDISTVTRRMSQKPTNLPFLNVVLNSAWMVVGRSLDPAVYKAIAAQALRTISEQLSKKADPHLEEMQQLLGRYQLWIHEPDEKILLALHQRALKSAPLVEPNFAFESASEQAPPPLVCTICGLQNPTGSRKCRSCGGGVATQSKSMQGLEELAGIDLSNAPRLEQLMLLAVQVMRGKARPDALLAHCDQLEAELEVAVQACPDGTGFAKGGAAAEVETAGEDYLEAMTAISELIKLLRELVENPNPELMISIAQELAEINRLLVQVKQTVAPLLV